MQTQLELDMDLNVDTPEGRDQNAFLAELATTDLATTLRKAAMGTALTDTERQQLHLLATDLQSGSAEIVETGSVFAPPF